MRIASELVVEDKEHMPVSTFLRRAVAPACIPMALYLIALTFCEGDAGFVC